MQPADAYDTNVTKSAPVVPVQHGAAAEEYLARLKLYASVLSGIEPKKAVLEVVKGIMGESEEPSPVHQKNLAEAVGPMVKKIIEMEKNWFGNVSRAHERAEQYYGENQEKYQAHTDLMGADPVVSQEKLKRLLRQKETIEKWKPGSSKVQNLQRLAPKIESTRLRAEGIKATEQRYGKAYWEGLRRYLRGAGFLVAPSYLPPSAVFPREDWILADTEPSYEGLSRMADGLMLKYHILGTRYSGLLYNTAKPEDQTSCGCVCVSWVKTTSVTDAKAVIVPFLGMSGGAPSVKMPSFLEAMLGACALPPYASMIGRSFIADDDHNRALDMYEIDPSEIVKDEDYDESLTPEVLFNRYYDEIMSRANNLAINYRVRELLKLRLPSRQSMLSYLGLSFFPTKRADLEENRTLARPAPGVALWHSLNCAEPAALAWISSVLVDGQDAYLCCPYEGMDEVGALGLKPKETCPWCATVEIAYRSLKGVGPVTQETPKQWEESYGKSMVSGKWPREITFADKFEDRVTDQQSRAELPRNKRTLAPAYPEAVNHNVAVLREIFREVGLLRKSTIRLGQPALWQTD